MRPDTGGEGSTVLNLDKTTVAIMSLAIGLPAQEQKWRQSLRDGEGFTKLHSSLRSSRRLKVPGERGRVTFLSDRGVCVCVTFLSDGGVCVSVSHSLVIEPQIKLLWLKKITQTHACSGVSLRHNLVHQGIGMSFYLM